MQEAWPFAFPAICQLCQCGYNVLVSPLNQSVGLRVVCRDLYPCDPIHFSQCLHPSFVLWAAIKHQLSKHTISANDILEQELGYLLRSRVGPELLCLWPSR